MLDILTIITNFFEGAGLITCFMSLLFGFGAIWNKLRYGEYLDSVFDDDNMWDKILYTLFKGFFVFIVCILLPILCYVIGSVISGKM